MLANHPDGGLHAPVHERRMFHDRLEHDIVKSRRDGLLLDDFGTGYSSLSYLKKFDIDNLKIARSFTRNLAPESSDMALSEAIIMMAHKLDLLLQAGRDYGQGYLFAHPMPGAAVDCVSENVLHEICHPT